jgi:MYXO-CTERM domain-containing protein
MEHAGPTCGACGHDPNDNAGAAAVMALAGLGLRVQITRVKE